MSVLVFFFLSRCAPEEFWSTRDEQIIRNETIKMNKTIDYNFHISNNTLFMAAIALLAPFIPTEIEVLAYIAWERLTEWIRKTPFRKNR